jgi:hypothetical protein
MNKLTVLLFILLLYPKMGLFAQNIPGLNFSTYSNNYTSVHTYNGVTAYNAYSLRVTHSGKNLNVPNWKMSVRVTQPITSTDGTNVFPAEMLSFQPVSTSGQNPSGGVPTISQIGAPLSVSMNGMNETFLIPQSNAPLFYTNPNNTFYDLTINYNLTIAAGAYLQHLQGGYSQKRYMANFEFRFYGTNNQLLGTSTRSYTIDVFNLGGAPSQYVIKISGEALNGLLDIQTPADYANGADVVYPSSLSVQSNVGYQLKVRSINPELTSSLGNSLPLNTVKLELIHNSGASATTSPVMLSSSLQTISIGNPTGNNSTYFDIKYSTIPNNQNLIQVPSGIYGTILEYQITPQ